MPELPEVEVICQMLQQSLLGDTLVKTKVFRRDLRLPIPQDFEQKTARQDILSIRRRSKYLWVDLKSGETLVIHLGMSGRLFMTSRQRPRDRHDHVFFEFSSGKHLRFRDPRRFGLVILCPTKLLEQHRLFKHLGVEPLSRQFHYGYWQQLCSRSSSSIKSLLMNASAVVGVGNIYANEALYLAGIPPFEVAKNLSKEQVKTLCQAVKRVLKKSIKDGGTSFQDFVHLSEKPGLHQMSLYVYGREGLACKNCPDHIQRITQNQRSTFFCPSCQRAS